MSEPARSGRARREGSGRVSRCPASSGWRSSSSCPFYVILAVALGTIDPILQQPQPAWSPLDWDWSAFRFVFENLFRGDTIFGKVFMRTFVYVAVAVVLSLVIAYPVAYFVARFGGRWKGLLLLGLIAPFLISYLMRMLAWINLLQDDGWVNDVLLWVGISTRRTTGSTVARRG